MLVVADTALLDTLHKRDFRAGYAEMAKFGLLGDAAFFVGGDPKARAALGWEPRVTLEDGLRLTVEHFRREAASAMNG